MRWRITVILIGLLLWVSQGLAAVVTPSDRVTTRLNVRDGPSTATGIVGEAWRALGEYQKAIGYYEQALKIAEKTWGEDHPNTNIIRQNLEELRQVSE